jgi:hypothetical protein
MTVSLAECELPSTTMKSATAASIPAPTNAHLCQVAGRHDRDEGRGRRMRSKAAPHNIAVCATVNGSCRTKTKNPK